MLYKCSECKDLGMISYMRKIKRHEQETFYRSLMGCPVCGPPLRKVRSGESRWAEEEICMPYNPDEDDDKERAERFRKAQAEMGKLLKNTFPMKRPSLRQS